MRVKVNERGDGIDVVVLSLFRLSWPLNYTNNHIQLQSQGIPKDGGMTKSIYYQ